MKQAIGTTQIMNYIMIFIVITFCFLVATLGYMKAFKINSKIANAIEKYEGYNSYSKNEIVNSLTSVGYQQGKVKCSNGFSDLGYYVCITPPKSYKQGDYIRYKITTYIHFGPILGVDFQIPINSQTEKIYIFSK